MNELQQSILDSYREVERICTQEGLSYFAIGGTAIGTIRHRGFIPWDDDLDIAMPIEDYEHFIQVAPELLRDPFKLITSDNTKEYANIFVKVVNENTTLIEECISDLPGRYTGVWVDIMPMSGIPTGYIKDQIFANELILLKKLNRKIRWPYSKIEKLLGKLLYIVALPLRAMGKYNYASTRYMKILNKYPFKQADYTGYTWSDKLKDLIFPKEWFADYILMPFEDTQMRMPVGYHEYLTQQFGEYMTVPPPEQQITHRVFADLEHSYKDYQSGKLKIPEDYFDAEE